MILCVAAVPFGASAVTFDTNTLEIKPGNVQFEDAPYSLSWLDKLIVRDDAMSIQTARMVPKADYPYRTTYDNFVKDVNEATILNALNENTVNDALEMGFKAFYYVVTAMGMTTDFDTMYSYVAKKGIRVPANMTAEDKIALAVAYACIKYNAVYVLYEKNITFTKGMTLDEAAAVVMAEIADFSTPSSVRSISGLAMYFMKDYLTGIDGIPLSDNPDMDELFHWIRAVAAANQGYSVPMIEFDKTTQAQRDYVNYCYYASMFDTFYDIHINPFELVKADNEGDVTSIPKLIVKTMLDEKNVKYDADSECENLFDLACKNGCFNLDEEFYSDICNYDLYVVESCQKLWVTPFALADQLGGNNNNLKVKIGSKTISSAGTTFVKLEPSKKTQTLKIVVTYDDANGEYSQTTYKFNIIKTKEEKDAQASDDLISKIEHEVKAVVPDSNEKANGVVDGVFSAVKNAATGASEIVDGNVSAWRDLELSTYGFDGSDETTAAAASNGNASNDGEKSATSSSDFEFDYLSELFSQTYADSKSHSSYSVARSKENTENGGAIQKTVTAIKKNPEIVAAPTSVVTFGALAGYLFTKKRKNTGSHIENEDTTSNEK